MENLQKQIDKSFKSVSKATIAKLFIDNSISLNSSIVDEENSIKQSKLTKTIFFNETEKCQTLVSLCRFYKFVRLVIQKLSIVMTSFTVDKMEMFTRFSFSTQAFLADTQQQVDHRHSVERNWVMGMQTLKLIKQRMETQLSNQKVISFETQNCILQIVDFLLVFSENLISAKRELKKIWLEQSEAFKKINSSNADKSCLNLLESSKWRMHVERSLSKDPKMDEFNNLILEYARELILG